MTNKQNDDDDDDDEYDILFLHFDISLVFHLKQKQNPNSFQKGPYRKKNKMMKLLYSHRRPNQTRFCVQSKRESN
jgi:hypothetical protein